MKKTLRWIFLVACCSGSALAQSASEQTRQVKDQILTSTSLPSIRVKFDDRFKYVGTQRFVLYERAQVEQHFFVDADSQRRIKRMYMVQFEGYLPGVDATYNYPVIETVTLGGQTYIVNAESVPNVSAALKQNPQSDAARAASFLESKGYRMSESIRFQRFVRLVDETKRNEIIFLYIEEAAAMSAEEKVGKVGKEFLTRALQGFTILK
ncbi:MAG TPA: hypothetical protein VI031_07555 [Pyrinomonadaceae bacterium]